MSTRHSPAEMNAQADDRASRAASMSFHSADPGFTGDDETTIPRESLTWSAAGSAGAHPLQVAADGRAWHQMLAVTVPDGTTVTHIAYRDSGGNVLSYRAIPQVTGPLDPWDVSFPITTNKEL